MKTLIKLSFSWLLNCIPAQLRMRLLMEDIEGVQKSIESMEKLKRDISIAYEFIIDIKKNPDNVTHVRRTIGNQKYLAIEDKMVEAIKASKSIIESTKDTNQFLRNNQTTFKEIEKHLQKSGQIINEKSIENAADLWHKIILTFLRCFQIFIFIFVTYKAVQFATENMEEKNLYIPRGLINIVPSEALSIQTKDIQPHQQDSDNTDLSAKKP